MVDNGDTNELLAWLGSGIGIAITVAVWLLFFIAYVRIIQKAGWSGWWILIGLVPVVNVVMFLVFAYSRWPLQRENDELRARLNLPPTR
jgi:hypothetical protein